jgi:hypothetical protein
MKARKIARRAYLKDDNSDDMAEMEAWYHAEEWISRKLNEPVY